MKYLIKTAYEKTSDTGKIIIVKEQYLTEAELFGEAEQKAYEYIKPFVNGQQRVTGISECRFQEMFLDNEGDKYFKAKVDFTVEDDKGKDKVTTESMLISADNITDAKNFFEDGMAQSMADWTLVGISETKIVDIIE